MVDVKIGRLVERVCVDVVGKVLLLTRACVVSDEFSAFSLVVDDELLFVPLVVVGGTATEMFALIM